MMASTAADDGKPLRLQLTLNWPCERLERRLRRLSTNNSRRTRDPVTVRMVSVVRDVNASKQALQLLRTHYERLKEQVDERTHALAKANDQVTREIEERGQSEARFAVAFHLAPVPMVVSLLDGFRIPDVNEAFVDTLGHAAAETIGRIPISVRR